VASKQVICQRGHRMEDTRKFHPNGDTYCCTCKLIRYKKSRKAYPEIHAEYQRKSNRKRLYGLSDFDYNLLLETQKGLCGICKVPERELAKRLHVDHDPVTNIVRGLLCHGCNTGLGLLREDVDILIYAVEYLKKSKK